MAVVLQPEARISSPGHVHLTWSIGRHVAARLAATRGVSVPTRWTTERAWAEAGGRVDRLTELLRAKVVITGLVTSQRGGALVVMRILEHGAEAPRWEREFSYPQTTLREIEDAVVAAAVQFLSLRTPVAAANPNVADAQAHDELSRGDYFLAQHDSWGPDSARLAYERALTREPRSALLMARLARAYGAALEKTGRVGPLSAQVGLREATSLVERALKIEEATAEAWTARAVLNRFRDPSGFDGAVRAHERAVALAPRSADAHHEYAVTLLRLGRDQAAQERLRQAVALERDRASTLRALAEVEYLNRRFENACALVNASIGADSYDPLAYALRARIRTRLDEFRDAFSDAETARRLSDAAWGETLEFYVSAIGSNPDLARTESRRLAATKLRPGVTLGVREAAFLGMGLGAVGNRDKAFDALSRARPRGAELRAALRDPGFDSLRSDPRFRQVGREAPRSSGAAAQPAAPSGGTQ